MSTLDHDRIDELLAGYVLRSLSGEDAAEADVLLFEHVPACSQCRATLNDFNGTLYNRQLALFYADHDLKPNEAYANAAKEYTVRRDIYGADALAWAALKAGKLDEAQAAIKDAMRLNTDDASCCITPE